MPTPLRRRFRFARRGVAYTVALLLVLVAVVVGIANQLLPLAERHPDKIAAWLSERAGRRVVFDNVQTHWTRRGPLLRLDGLEIGDPRNPVVIGEAEMLVSMYAGLLPGRSFSELRLRGLDLTLERADDGRWQVRGLPGQQQAGGDPLATLEGLGELQVIDGRLAVIAPSLGIDARLPKVDLRLRVQGDRVRVGLRAWMQPGVSPIDAALDFNRRRGDGRAYVGARKADLAAWSPMLRLAGVAVTGGRGNAQAWAELRGHRVAVVTLDTALDDIRLRGAPLRDNPEARGATRVSQKRFDRVQARVRWRVANGGWRMDAPQLRIDSGKQLHTLDGLVLAGGQRYAMLAEHIDAGPLFAVAALSDRLNPALRRWLLAAAPALVLQQVEVAGVRGGRMRAEGRIEQVEFAPVGNAPGLRGLSGTLQGDDAGFAFQFDPRTPLTFHWPSGFAVSHVVDLQGGVSGWRDDAGWRIASSGLRIDGKGYGADVRGGLWFQGDGTRPRIDIAARLDETAVSTVKGFWVRHRMPAATIHWLDAALQDGRVRDGRALIAGDLDDWPFVDNNGRFEATATISAGTVKFQPDWPALVHVDADVAFIADGFTIGGKGTLAGIGIRRFEAGIAHFGQAELSVQAEGGGDASRLLALLRESPLRKQHEETLVALSAAGPAQVTFDLDLPFHRAGKVMQLGGTVALGGASLADSRWKLAFEDVRGKAAYDNKGFKADALRVIHDGQPGQLALRAGKGHVRDPVQAFEAELEAKLDADALLDRAPQLAWLKTHVQGRSPWTIAVTIPATGNTQPAPDSRLQLRSSLVGTRLDLPAPLRKPAAQALALRIDTSLPLDSGDIAVAFGDRMALRARSANGQTGVRVQLGSDHVEQPAPASGLIATGRTATLDAIDWIALTRADGSGNGNGLSLRSIDVSAGQLQLLGGNFRDTRVQAEPTANGIAVRLEGAALAGTLQLPHVDTAVVTGRLQRLHWNALKPASRTEPKSDASAAAASLDPSRIPPLNLVVDEFRVGDAQLGSALLRTQPVAGGMRIEQLQTRAPRHRIDASGDWLGRGSSARTQLKMDLDSDDFGALLAGFGFGGRMTGGDGQVHFNAAWPGSPGTFKPGTIDGTLTLAVHDGQLVEVEPGAGRVLGLLSLTDLPRRLTLDFGDFFSEGFSFNRIGGAVRVTRGIARSDDLVIEGPAAEIRITGSADLRAQTYDQTIEVLPRTGNLLAVAGAIAGGPVGAAIGAAANLVLKKPLGQVAAKTYRVTGPWKEPDVKVISRDQGRASRASPAVDQGDPDHPVM